MPSNRSWLQHHQRGDGCTVLNNLLGEIQACLDIGVQSLSRLGQLSGTQILLCLTPGRLLHVARLVAVSCRLSRVGLSLRRLPAPTCQLREACIDIWQQRGHIVNEQPLLCLSQPRRIRG